MGFLFQRLAATTFGSPPRVATENLATSRSEVPTIYKVLYCWVQEEIEDDEQKQTVFQLGWSNLSAVRACIYSPQEGKSMFINWGVPSEVCFNNSALFEIPQSKPLQCSPYWLSQQKLPSCNMLKPPPPPPKKSLHTASQWRYALENQPNKRMVKIVMITVLNKVWLRYFSRWWQVNEVHLTILLSTLLSKHPTFYPEYSYRPFNNCEKFKRCMFPLNKWHENCLVNFKFNCLLFYPKPRAGWSRDRSLPGKAPPTCSTHLFLLPSPCGSSRMVEVATVIYSLEDIMEVLVWRAQVKDITKCSASIS